MAQCSVPGCHVLKQKAGLCFKHYHAANDDQESSDASDDQETDDQETDGETVDPRADSDDDQVTDAESDFDVDFTTDGEVSAALDASLDTEEPPTEDETRDGLGDRPVRASTSPPPPEPDRQGPKEQNVIGAVYRALENSYFPGAQPASSLTAESVLGKRTASVAAEAKEGPEAKKRKTSTGAEKQQEKEENEPSYFMYVKVTRSSFLPAMVPVEYVDSCQEALYLDKTCTAQELKHKSWLEQKPTWASASDLIFKAWKAQEPPQFDAEMQTYAEGARDWLRCGVYREQGVVTRGLDSSENLLFNGFCLNVDKKVSGMCLYMDR
jgi:hypothetical protein